MRKAASVEGTRDHLPLQGNCRRRLMKMTGKLAGNFDAGGHAVTAAVPCPVGGGPAVVLVGVNYLLQLLVLVLMSH